MHYDEVRVCGDDSDKMQGLGPKRDHERNLEDDLETIGDRTVGLCARNSTKTGVDEGSSGP